MCGWMGGCQVSGSLLLLGLGPRGQGCSSPKIGCALPSTHDGAVSRSRSIQYQEPNPQSNRCIKSVVLNLDWNGKDANPFHQTAFPHSCVRAAQQGEGLKRSSQPAVSHQQQRDASRLPAFSRGRRAPSASRPGGRSAAQTRPKRARKDSRGEKSPSAPAGRVHLPAATGGGQARPPDNVNERISSCLTRFSNGYATGSSWLGPWRLLGRRGGRSSQPIGPLSCLPTHKKAVGT
jgi:hypothetical protein